MQRQLFEVAVKLKEEVGCHISFINLSGGVGVNYTPDQEPNDIRVIGEGVHKVYDEILVPAGMGDVAIYTELGRFMLAPYGCACDAEQFMRSTLTRNILVWMHVQ